MTTAVHQLGVQGLLEAFASGRITVAAATDHYLARIARFDSGPHGLAAFTHVDAEGAKRAAATSAERFAAGTARTLEGVPLAIKANVDVAGMPVTGGIGAFATRIAATDADVVARLRAAGAVILGLTNLHEGALGATTDNPFFGRTHNPHRHGFTPGGSSGGSGAAVAAGLCAAAIGTDTLGSIRIPAAYCGIVGLKPGNGLLPMHGVLPLAPRLDCVGPMARSVEDCALLLSALAPLPGAPPIGRVATLSGLAAKGSDKAVLAATRLAVQLLRGLQVEVTDHSVRIDPAKLRLAGFLEAARAAGEAHAVQLAANPGGFSEAFRNAVGFGTGMDQATIALGRRTCDAAANEVHALLAMVDAVLLPTVPQAAFVHGTRPPPNQADFTALANIAGLPALAIPAGWTADGLPVGVQLIGRAGSEAALLALGARLQAALGPRRLPSDYM